MAFALSTSSFTGVKVQAKAGRTAARCAAVSTVSAANPYAGASPRPTRRAPTPRARARALAAGLPPRARVQRGSWPAGAALGLSGKRAG